MSDRVSTGHANEGKRDERNISGGSGDGGAVPTAAAGAQAVRQINRLIVTLRRHHPQATPRPPARLSRDGDAYLIEGGPGVLRDDLEESAEGSADI